MEYPPQNTKSENPVIARLSEKKKPVFRKNCSKNGFRSYGTPDAIRTHGLQSRSLSLYPAELRAHIGVWCIDRTRISLKPLIYLVFYPMIITQLYCKRNPLYSQIRDKNALFSSFSALFVRQKYFLRDSQSPTDMSYQCILL